MPATTIEEVFEDGALPLGEDLRAAVDEWLAYLEHERGRPARRSRPTSATCVSSWSGSRPTSAMPRASADLARLDARRFRAFMASRRRARFAGRSLARTMSALRAFFRWLEAEEIAKSRAVLLVAMPKVPHGIPKPLTVAKAAAVVDGGRAGETDWAAARDTAVLLLLYGSRPAHLRGPLAAAQGRAPRRPRRSADCRQGRQGAPRAVTARHAGRHRPLHRVVPLSARPGGSPLPRRQRRPSHPAHRPAAHGAPARRAGPARHRDAARAAPLLRHAPALRRRRPAPDPGAARPRQPVHHPGLHRGRPRPACSPSTTRPTRSA